MEYKCNICKDEGFIFYKKRMRDNKIYEFSRPCECQIQMQNEKRIEQSNISELFKRCTFFNFAENTNEQKQTKTKAVGFYREVTSQNPANDKATGLLFYGQVGSGKTHLAVATLNNFMKYGKSGLYVNYKDLVRRLSQIALDYNAYTSEIDRCINIDVLLIDDLFKSRSLKDITQAQLNYMYEIINYRYMNKKTTIFTTEKSSEELLEIDSAIASRILQMTDKRYVLNMNNISNYRLA